MKINRDVALYGLEIVSEEMVDKIEGYLEKTLGHCPCIPRRKHSPETLCEPCKEARETGYCHCGLYRPLEK